MREEVEVLLLIAHPDDDAIFAGALQHAFAMFRWGVACVTWNAECPRGAELLAWQSRQGVSRERIAFLDLPDDPEDYRNRRCTIDPREVVARLAGLAWCPRLVVTHNALGEYGHPHHVMVHHVARAAFAGVPRLVFGAGRPGAELAVPCGDKWPAVRAAYPSQAHVIDKFVAEHETFFWDAP